MSYRKIIERIFEEKYEEGSETLPFEREDLVRAAEALGVDVPKNLGDVIYNFRYRSKTPPSIERRRPSNKEWTIEGTGDGVYAFRLVPLTHIVPNDSLATIKIPNATPEIVSSGGMNDEQALLAKIRYSRLIDLFLGISAYSLQNHLRTKVKGIGQIEVDELYIGVDHRGRQYVIPVQAKGGKDKLSTVQTRQDLALCEKRFPGLICRSISAQFTSDGCISLFELVEQNGTIKVAEERRYKLVPAGEINEADLEEYSK